MSVASWLFLLVAWVGHGYIWTGILNFLYARSLPKKLLKPFRVFVGVIIVGYPVAVYMARTSAAYTIEHELLKMYLVGCLLVGLLAVPAVTFYRMCRPKPAALVAEHSELLRLGDQLGEAAVGDGKHRWMSRLPLTDCFTVELTHQTLAVPGLPAKLDGLTLLLVSDLHWHGTPSRAWFDAVFDHLCALPPADLVVMAGDVVDTDTHHAWIQPVLGRLTAVEHKLAVLGNHDAKHNPKQLRAELSAAGYTVLGSGWRELTIRGERVVVVGHEGPWFDPPLGIRSAPADGFRLCVSHTPDNFPWAAANGCGLTVAGHVHGGQVRLPVVTSIFVPSTYGRRFDQGVHELPGGVLAVSRGLSGNEPLRFRCRPQVVRLTLVPRSVG